MPERVVFGDLLVRVDRNVVQQLIHGLQSFRVDAVFRLLHTVQAGVGCFGDGGQSQEAERTVRNRIRPQAYAAAFFKLQGIELAYVVAHRPDGAYRH